VVCPDDGGGLAERKSRFGKMFYGCVNYPNCKFAAWDRPVPGPCPTCGATYLLSKASKRDGKYLACPNKECDFRQPLPDEPAPIAGEPGAPTVSTPPPATA
jgi:DNA topoisomerase-1